MARRVTWSETAWQELQCAANFIERDSPPYAAALIDETRSAARSLKNFPACGRVVPELGDENVREIFVKRYRLIYQIEPRRVVVLAFIHGARVLPNL